MSKRRAFIRGNPTGWGLLILIPTKWSFRDVRGKGATDDIYSRDLIHRNTADEGGWLGMVFGHLLSCGAR
uniref:Putative secreted protein n=1 Tax=Anopheles darlingi TaxID=43151 RepID=A0A2M4DC37_ANODA